MDFVTRYGQPSAVDASSGLLLVFMASTRLDEQAATASPQIFSGQIARPLVFRNLLLCLRQTVESRFYRPDLWRLLDPVITSGDRLLRLECFSSCASVYARVDLTEDAFADGAFHREGTTNVDFNSVFLNHLSQLRPGKQASFEMGEQSVRLESHRGEAVEHKVKLPERWIKGFLQVQAVQRRAAPVFELDRMSARQLLTSIPAASKGPLYLAPAARGVQILHRKPAAKGGFIEVAGAHRLRLLQSLTPDLKAVRVYQTPQTGASVWVVETGAAQLTLGLSSAVSHGFSGDGDALRQLSAVEIDETDLVFARAAARALGQFDIEELAAHQELPPPRAAEIVDRLSMQGLLGYDRDRGKYYYRMLPFLAAGGNAPQRLQNADKLLDRDAVEIERCRRTEGGLEAAGRVRGAGGVYQASLRVDEQGYLQDGSCSCPWVQRHGLQRGPCKHLLALRFAAEARR